LNIIIIISENYASLIVGAYRKCLVLSQLFSYTATVGDPEVGDAVGTSVTAGVGAGVLRTIVGCTVVGDTVGESVGEGVGESVGDGVGESVGDGLGTKLGDVLKLGTELGILVNFLTAETRPITVPAASFNGKFSIVKISFSRKLSWAVSSVVTQLEFRSISAPVSNEHVVGFSDRNVATTSVARKQSLGVSFLLNSPNICTSTRVPKS